MPCVAGSISNRTHPHLSHLRHPSGLPEKILADFFFGLADGHKKRPPYPPGSVAAILNCTDIESSPRCAVHVLGTLLRWTILGSGLEVEFYFPVRFVAQSQARIEAFALFGNESFEYAGSALRTERLNLLRREGLLRNGLVDAEVAAFAIAAATVEVLTIGLFDDTLLAFRARERSGRRGIPCIRRR